MHRSDLPHSVLSSCCGNGLVLVLASVVSYVLMEVYHMEDVLQVTGDVQSGIPGFHLPWHFGSNKSELDAMVGPVEIALELGLGLVMVPLVSMVQAVAIVHQFSEATHRVDSTQEMIALGACQLVGSFAGSLPVTVSLGRSSVNKTSGVRTPFGGIITGLVVVAACTALTPHFAYIPKAALAAVIIASVAVTVDVGILRPIWRSKKVDLLPYAITLLLGIGISIEWGMIAGTAAHLCLLLYASSRPAIRLTVKAESGIEFAHLQPDQSLGFPSVARLQDKVTEAAKCGLPIVLDFGRVQDVDFSAAQAIRAMETSLALDGQAMVFCRTSPAVEAVLRGANEGLPVVAHASIEEAVKCLDTTLLLTGSRL